MFKKVFLLLLLAFIAGGLIFSQISSKDDFESLDSQAMYQKIISERDLAIQKAVESGDYRCCIYPPCTMCYMEANQWNNFKAGTCACDQLIAQRKEPCPQCKKGLCSKDENGACLVKEKEDQ
ncbi:hypothetical protein KKD61_00230 [Patescibacteria group bacterium]|nr:hypothetical protein [Patescibacteria group bacterium]